MLTSLQVKNAKPGRHSDGRGLYLLVKPSGTRSWVLRIVVDGKRRDFGLGPTDLVSLAEARDKAIEGRKLVRDGRDPAIEWRRVSNSMPSFKEAAEQYYANVKEGWKNAKHARQWWKTLEDYAFPAIGATAVDRVDTAALQGALLPLWLKVPETSRRVAQRIGAVLDFAHGQGWRVAEAPMRAVLKGLPKQSKADRHHDAMPYEQLPAFVAKLQAGGETLPQMALRFTILTAARSGEILSAKWSEIDLKAKVWSIPADKMKAGEAHSVPLSDAALEILERVASMRSNNGDYVFPGRSGKPLGKSSLGVALERAGGGAYTVHGMRSAFRDWAAEKMPQVPGDVAEAALAHKVRNKTEAAYRRTKFLEQRRELMSAWGEFLGGLK